MKKFNLFSSAMVAALMLASCSAEDVVNNTTSETHTSYLTVSLANVGGSSFNGAKTRASYTQGGGDYEDGTTDESALTNVRFYFFDANGNAYNLVGGVNYVDRTDFSSGNGDESKTEETKTNVDIVIKSGTATKAQQMVVVVNPASCSGLGDGSKSIKDLEDAYTENAAWSSGKEEFLMSNSVYVGSDNAIHFQETGIADKMKETEEEAKQEANVVTVHVERVAAKVSVDDSKMASQLKDGEETVSVVILSDGTKLYPVATKVEGVTGETVYAKIEGWGVADENPTADLVKKIDASWSNLGFTPWTSTDYHRSYWEMAPLAHDKTVYTNHSWNDYATNKTLKEVIYTLPNTINGENGGKNTKVLLVATLCDNTGKAIQFGTYNAQNYASEDAMKTAILQNIGGENYFVGDSKTSIDIKNITFNSQPSGKADYILVPELASDVTIVKDADGNDKTKEIKEKLAEIEATWYTEGACYYQANIRHLASEKNATAYYGVVRNHSYVLELSGVQGFGTPVYKKDEIIDPTIPETHTYFLAATLHVLSWRIVTNSSVVLQ